MENVDYQDQSAFGLMLNVIEGDIDKEQFDLRTNNKIIMPNFNIEASIIGASHIISFVCPRLVFHEVFACCDVHTHARRAFFGPLEKVMGKQHLVFGDFISYEFNAELVAWKRGQKKLAQLENQINTKGGKKKEGQIGVEYCFAEGSDGITPKTIILVEAGESFVSIETLHSYPNEMNLVFTKTDINIQH